MGGICPYPRGDIPPDIYWEGTSFQSVFIISNACSEIRGTAIPVDESHHIIDCPVGSNQLTLLT
ncbi:hypothetical protein KY290_032037 [Solanum tuberosum]|uniref:Uncharacterized protein n=1 Tax=Solanum tuberosum TaxID=4113 RepID=A0ABQ7UBL8_SOLTU|nr:hypothetical protein KY290_032037 [Solanum tuberosum]